MADLEAFRGEVQARGREQRFEERRASVDGVDDGRDVARELPLRDRLAVDGDALADVLEMRAREEAGAQARRAQDAGRKPRGRALPFRARDLHDARADPLVRIAHPIEERADPPEVERARAWRATLDIASCAMRKSVSCAPSGN